MTNTDLDPTTTKRAGHPDPFGNIESKILQAIDEEVDDRRRRGLPIIVDRGNGVETLPS